MYNVLLSISLGTLVFTINAGIYNVVKSIKDIQKTLKRWEPIAETKLEGMIHRERLNHNNEVYMDEMWEKMKNVIGLERLQSLISRVAFGSPAPSENVNIPSETPLDQRVWNSEMEYVNGMWETLKKEVDLPHLESYIRSKLRGICCIINVDDDSKGTDERSIRCIPVHAGCGTGLYGKQEAPQRTPGDTGEPQGNCQACCCGGGRNHRC